MRVLFVGENWFGSCARACSASLRRLGCDVLDLDTQTFFPQWSAASLRLARRAISTRIIRDFNARLIEAAAAHQADMVLAFKGNFIAAESLRLLRRRGVSLYNYYPDRVVLARGTDLERTLPEYDCVFDTKRTWDCDMAERLRLRDRLFVPHGYDPEVHVPTLLTPAELRLFSSEVSFVGTHTSRKERLLEELIRFLPTLSLRIFGNDWARATSERLKPHIFGTAICGQSYSKVIAASRINLAIMGVSDRVLDETTTRTFEIPACGGFMLHERSPEVLSLYQEDNEIALFDSAEELANKVRFYLANPEKRSLLADAGRRRAVPAYSYDARMQTILAYHRAAAEKNSCRNIAC